MSYYIIIYIYCINHIRHQQRIRIPIPHPHIPMAPMAALAPGRQVDFGSQLLSQRSDWDP